MKYDVGDKVKIVNCIYGHNFDMDDEVEIEECIEEEFYRAIRDDGEWFHVFDSEIESIEISEK